MKGPSASPALVGKVFRVFVAAYFLHGLQAYNLGPIPLDWISQVLLIGTAGYLAFKRPVPLPPDFIGFKVFFAWVLVVTVVASGLFDYSTYVPPNAANPYLIYMALRLNFFLAFFGAGYTVWWLCRQGLEERITRAIVLVGGFLALAVLYIFVAQLTGLPEPPRTRLGTSGFEQATEFSGGIVRALGTFREPSHMASWMMLPLLISLRKPFRLAGIPTAMMALSILLSASLSSFIALTAALTVGMLFFGWRSTRVMTSLALAVLLLGGGVLVFDMVSLSASKSKVSFTKMLQTRLEPLIAEKGLKGSNRIHIYRYAEQQKPGLAGIGWGNANLVFAHGIGLDVVATFSSLYLNALMSTGFVGLGLIILAVLWPIIRAISALRGRAGIAEMMAAMSAYVAWATLYTGLFEEFYPSFAVALALLAFRTRLALQARATKPSAAPGTLPPRLAGEAAG
ncbi:MAG: hypothetical protein HZC36_05340 [Armatimonadetes bacterium]|nr:hypothetical protein [Armatimonadota bacterium]